MANKKYTITIDGIIYDIYDDNTASVARYDTICSEYIEIPPTIEHGYQNYNVTRIGHCAFLGCTSIKYMKIPDSVTSIEDSAFMLCSYLTYVEIGKSVTSIGKNAFYQCFTIVCIEIPNNTTVIGENAFARCSSLTLAVVPKGTNTSIFTECHNLRCICFI